MTRPLVVGHAPGPRTDPSERAAVPGVRAAARPFVGHPEPDRPLMAAPDPAPVRGRAVLRRGLSSAASAAAIVVAAQSSEAEITTAETTLRNVAGETIVRHCAATGKCSTPIGACCPASQ